MKSRLPPKPSKASLISRGLPAKDKTKPCSKARSKPKKPSSVHKPGYALYSTDSDAEQVNDVHKGLDRCAALLSHILDGEEHQGRSHGGGGKESQPKGVKKLQDKQKKPKSNLDKAQSLEKGKHLVPEALQRGPPYNERLPSSTPLMTPEQRQRQQSLAERQELLAQQIVNLSKQYNFVKEQPLQFNQSEQSILQPQLQSIQDESSVHQPHKKDPLYGTWQQPNGSVPSNLPLQQLGSIQTEAATNQPRVKVPLYNYREQQLPCVPSNSPLQPLENYLQTQPSNDYNMDFDVHIPERDPGPASDIPQTLPVLNTAGTQQPQVSKQVAFSDDITQHSFTTSPTCKSAVTQTSLVANDLQDLSPSPSPSSPKAVSCHVKTLQYLIGELRSLLGDSGDLELYRLLNEIDKAVSLLQFVQTGSTNTETNSIEMDLALQPLRTENAHLRRKLRITNQKLRDFEMKIHQSSLMSQEPSFELAACQSLNEILKQQVEQERNTRGKMARELTQLKKEVVELRSARQEMLESLAEKAHEAATSAQAPSPNAERPDEVSTMKRQLSSLQLALEAAVRENQITAITLKQKDQEIERLKEFTRGLQMFMKKIISDLDTLPGGNEIISLLTADAILQDVDQFLQDPLPPDRNTPLRHKQPSKNVPYKPQHSGTQERVAGVQLSHITDAKALKKHARFNESSSDDQEEVSKSIRGGHGIVKHPNNKEQDTPRKKMYSSPPKTELSEPSSYDRLNIAPDSLNVSPFKLTPSKESSYEHFDRAPGGAYVSPTQTKSPRNPELSSSGSDVSSLTSQDEEEFRKELANLDADIARLQAMLKETASK